VREVESRRFQLDRGQFPNLALMMLLGMPLVLVLDIQDSVTDVRVFDICQFIRSHHRLKHEVEQQSLIGVFAVRIEFRDLVLVVPIHRLFLELRIFRFSEEPTLSIRLEKNGSPTLLK
jgi:hypothetical protein